ncbi:MAG: PAS domain S-box protein, partial [Nitrospinae bacterium]|nr:PAS domain S-box protein [Nitrospinota bacterium]
SRKELIGLTPWDIHPMDGRERILKAFSEGIRTGHVTFINGKVLRKDRTIIPVDITGSVIQYGDKKVMQGIFRDVREREIFEQQIIESRLMFRTLLDSIHDYVSLHDTDCMIRMANTSLAEFMNLPIREMIGKKCEDVYHCKGIGENCPVIRATKSRKLEFSELAIYNRIFQVWAYPLLNIRGEFEGIIQQRRDITEQKIIESEIFQLEKMAELGNMVGGIAHELRNPLNTINTALYLLKKVVNESNVNVDSYISQIKNSVERCDNIIMDILNFARPSKTEIESINISSLIEQILVLIGVEISDKNIRVIKKLHDPNAAIEGSMNVVRQIFLNLITNSIQAMDENGEIIIETGLVQDCSLSKGCGCECVSIKISDNGIGMDAETLKNLFKPFFTTKKGGTGLGLYLIKKGVEKHKGRIDVQSEKGKGTTFVVELPVKQTQG